MEKKKSKTETVCQDQLEHLWPMALKTQKKNYKFTWKSISLPFPSAAPINDFKCIIQSTFDIYKKLSDL